MDFTIFSASKGILNSNLQNYPNEHAKLEKACREFESLFLNYLLQNMRRTIPKSNFFSGGFGKDIYTSLMDQELARVLSERKEIGIAKILIKQLEKNIYNVKNVENK